jgi:putative oxidoreductase
MIWGIDRDGEQSMSMTNLTRWAPYALGVLRIMTALLFLAHGTQKFLSFPRGERAGVGWEFANLGAYAGLIEIATGVLIALGWFTRPAAFLASGTMAVAYWYAHAPQAFFPINNGGDAAILYCFVFLYLVFAGPGALSIDGRARPRIEVTEAERL